MGILTAELVLMINALVGCFVLLGTACVIVFLLREEWKHTRERQARLDKSFDEQEARIRARDREVDLVIQDIPKRVQQSLQQAISLYVEPFAEDYREKKRKDDEPPPELFDGVPPEKLEAWLDGRIEVNG